MSCAQKANNSWWPDYVAWLAERSAPKSTLQKPSAAPALHRWPRRPAPTSTTTDQP